MAEMQIMQGMEPAQSLAVHLFDAQQQQRSSQPPWGDKGAIDPAGNGCMQLLLAHIHRAHTCSHSSTQAMRAMQLREEAAPLITFAVHSLSSHARFLSADLMPQGGINGTWQMQDGMRTHSQSQWFGSKL